MGFMDSMFEEIRARKIQEIVVLGAPASLRPQLSRLPVLTIHHHYQSVHKAGFWLAVVKQISELIVLAPEIAARASEDAILWLACPTKSSMCDLSDETCQENLLKHGFRRAEGISSDTRLMALRFERTTTSDIQNETPSESDPIHESDNPKPDKSKPGGNNATNARKTAPRAGRGSPNSARSGHAGNPKARPARPGSRSRGTSQSGPGNNDASKQ
jgi:hypothetical protein